MQVIAFVSKYLIVISWLILLTGCDNSNSEPHSEAKRPNLEVKTERECFYDDLSGLLDPNISTNERSEYFSRLCTKEISHSQFYREEKYVDMLMSAAKSHDETIRLYVVYLIQHTRSAKAFKCLEEIVMKDNVDIVKNNAVIELGKMGGMGLGDPLPVLQVLLESEHQIKHPVITAIGYIGSNASDDYLYNLFYKTKDEEIKVAIVGALMHRCIIPHSVNESPVTPNNKLLSFMIRVLDEPSRKISEGAYLFIIRFIVDIDEIIPERLRGMKKHQIPFTVFRESGQFLFRVDDLGVRSDMENNWNKYHDKMKEFWEINKNYFYIPNGYSQFIIDQEAKSAGIPTEEYRKTHPWFKEPDKTDDK